MVSILLVLGALINGPSALITTSISANLGSRVQNRNALATVTAIIDGTGSFGAAIGPFIAGFLSFNWKYVFYMMMASNFTSLLAISMIGIKEAKKIQFRNR